MKTFSAAALLILSLASIENTQAIQLNQRTQFVDDIVKALTESETQEQDENKNQTAAATLSSQQIPPPNNATLQQQTPANNATALSTPNNATSLSSPQNKTAVAAEKEDDGIPMNPEAIRAYSSVIADAAEDSEPEKPVIYTETDTERTEAERAKKRQFF